MGMTLDEAINRLEDLHFEQDDWEYGELTEDCLLNRDALRLAIDTIRKYQKIEQILKSLDDGEINYPQMTYYLREVLEDGNDKTTVNE